MEEGFYERIITKQIAKSLENRDELILSIEAFNKEDGAIYLNRFFQGLLQQAFGQLSMASDEIAKAKLIDLSNRLIQLLSEYCDDREFMKDQIEKEGQILKALFHRNSYVHSNLNDHIKEVFPFTGLSESELFTGSKAGISLESELKKEMLSSDEVWWLVSFVKFEGIRLFEQVFKILEQSGKKVKIICTVYMGATDLKAIDFLCQFSNIELKISFNTNQERLHAKSYLFLRNSGFHTGYIGSSNLSRTALTNGLEWNLKLTQQEIPHIITKCRNTFDTYWNDPDFVLYNSQEHREKLKFALQSSGVRINTDEKITDFFDIKPYPFQQEILDQLERRRAEGESRNLIVAATGTGKTVMAAFDFKRFLKSNPKANLLFVAHREEILKQARFTFRQILRDSDFGELWFNGTSPKTYQHLFVSIQTFNNRIESLGFAKDYYDFIIIDEVHHSAANSYQKLLGAFESGLLVGLTATPERHDGNDITAYFGNTISAEIRLPEALNRRLLCPFQYFGLDDNTNISRVSWRRGRYDIDELEKIYSEDNRRVYNILRNCSKYLKDPDDLRAIGFCVSKRHAKYMAEKFQAANKKAAVLTSDQSGDRNAIIQQFRRKEINYLFVVDMLNEGIDIPEVDTLLFLRPTESLTIFLQQLGRGLRLHDDKEYLTVLDFIGQAHVEYSFEHKFRGMLGKTHTRIKEELENDFPHLPLGCSIVLEKTARELILQNITRSIRGGKQKLLSSIRKFNEEYSIPCTLRNFSEYMDLSLHRIFSHDLLWFELLAEVNHQPFVYAEQHKQLAKTMSTTWISTDSLSYFRFLRRYFCEDLMNIDSKEDQQFLLMLYFDLFDREPDLGSFAELHLHLSDLFSEKRLITELEQYFDQRISELQTIEKPIILRDPSSLRLHGRYTRNQILIGFEKSNLNRKFPSREGVLVVEEMNTELFFVTLDKSQGKFNPSTMYHDYFVNEEIFHWQSQNSTSPSSMKGQSYIHHRALRKDILLFVREANKDEQNLTMAFVFCGALEYMQHTGNKPMSITWRMKHAPPALLLNEGRKLAIG